MIELAGIRIQLFTIRVFIVSDVGQEAVESDDLGAFIGQSMCENQEHRPATWLDEVMGKCDEEDIVDSARANQPQEGKRHRRRPPGATP